MQTDAHHILMPNPNNVQQLCHTHQLNAHKEANRETVVAQTAWASMRQTSMQCIKSNRWHANFHIHDFGARHLPCMCLCKATKAGKQSATTETPGQKTSNDKISNAHTAKRASHPQLIFHLQDFHPKMATNVQTLKAQMEKPLGCQSLTTSLV